MSKTEICHANTDAQAETIVQRLDEAGIPASDVCVLFPDISGSRDFAHQHRTQAAEGTTIGTLTKTETNQRPG